MDEEEKPSALAGTGAPWRASGHSPSRSDSSSPTVAMLRSLVLDRARISLEDLDWKLVGVDLFGLASYPVLV
jgi:hypothetical protein